MNKGVMAVVVIVLVAGSFYGGTVYAKSSTGGAGARGAAFRGGAQGQAFAGGQRGGFVTGEVIAKDATSITIKPRTGGSQIVFVSGSTAVMKAVSGTANDIVIGSQVTVTGAANQDGSVNAQMVQLRPATTTPNRAF